jgi:tetratricopeptide (TPR) repeat protein
LGWKSIGFAGIWFFAVLAPTSLVPGNRQTAAEHRMYLALIPVVVLVVVAIYRRLGRAALPICLVLAAGLFGITWQRNKDYRSALGLWSDTVAKSPANPWAHDNLGCELADVPGRSSEAIAEFETALRLKPDHAEAHNNLGYALAAMPGRLDDAIAQYEEALRLKSDFAEAHNNLGDALVTMPGRLNDAIAQYEEALRLNPDYAEVHNNLGNALLTVLGRSDDAIAQFREALRLKPDLAEAHNNLGNALSNVPGRLNDAIAQYGEALRLKPDYANAYVSRGFAYLKKGDFVRSLADCNEAIRLQPGLAIAYSTRADTYAGSGDYDHAIADYIEAIRVEPGLAVAYNNLAWLWAACSEDRIRNGRKAEEYAKKACELAGWKNPEYIDTLAVACAEAGHYSEALKWENRYLDTGPAKQTADSARQRLGLFEAKRPYHEVRSQTERPSRAFSALSQ